MAIVHRDFEMAKFLVGLKKDLIYTLGGKSFGC